MPLAFTQEDFLVLKMFDCFFQKLANLLYESAREHSCVDPTKVGQILGVSQEEAAVPEKPVQG